MFLWSLIGSIFVIILLKKLIQRYLHDCRLPDGPWGLPFFGYSLFLTQKPYLKFIQLTKKYGSIFSINLGEHTAVVLNDYKAVKEIYGKDASLGRPYFSIFNEPFPNAPNFFNDSGDIWKEHRRFTMRSLRELGFGNDIMENSIKEEMNHLMKAIDEHNGKPFDIKHFITASSSNAIFKIMFGYRLDYNDEHRLSLNEIAFKVAPLFRVFCCHFLLKYKIRFRLFLYRMLKRLNDFNKFMKFFRESIQEKFQKYTEGNPIECYIDAYICEMKNRLQKDQTLGSFHEHRLRGNLFFFFLAGGETVRPTLFWFFKLLIKHPDVQKKIQNEIDEVVGHDRLPSWSDRAHLPFTKATLMEIQRLATVAPLIIPHRAMEDIPINGKIIPKDTEIMANLYAISYDENVYENPYEFNPYRFLEKDGKTERNYEAYIPFGYGKRSCIGEVLVKFEIFFHVTIILQKYNFKAANINDIDNFDTTLGTTLVPSLIPKIIFEKRKLIE